MLARRDYVGVTYVSDCVPHWACWSGVRRSGLIPAVSTIEDAVHLVQSGTHISPRCTEPVERSLQAGTLTQQRLDSVEQSAHLARWQTNGHRSTQPDDLGERDPVRHGDSIEHLFVPPQAIPPVSLRDGEA